MKTLKHKRSTAMVNHIKNEQEKRGYTDVQVAEQIGIPLTTYKNIVRTKGGNDFVKESIINKLAVLYDCSTDYLLGLSNDPTLDRNERVIKRALDFKDKHRLISELNNYLNSDYKTLYALHFLLCQNPSWRRDEYLKGFHAYTDVLIESSFLELFQERSKGDYNLLVKDTIKFNDEYFNHILKLRKANSLLETADFESSLKTYFEIIYDTLTQSIELEPIANKAIQQVLWIKQNWEKFPTELNIIMDTLPQIQHYHFLISGLSNKELLGTDDDNKTYAEIKLSEQIINTLKQYLFSMEEK